jgi:succinoglycan biosynthesis protein ExoA
VTYRPRASVRALARQYFHYGRWRRVVARQHSGTINPRYLAPPAAVLVMVAGLLAGLAGLGWLLDGAAGLGPTLATCGFVIPAAYAVGVIGVAVAATRRLRFSVAARLPAALATMHIAWGLGFLTSPRSLIPGHVGRRRPSRPARPDG